MLLPPRGGAITITAISTDCTALDRFDFALSRGPDRRRSVIVLLCDELDWLTQRGRSPFLDTSIVENATTAKLDFTRSPPAWRAGLCRCESADALQFLLQT